MKIEYNKDITHLTTFQIPVRAAIYAEYESEKDLLQLSRTPDFTDNEMLHIGSGSNLLFVNDFDGIVLHSGIKGITQYRKNDDTVFVIAGAGERWTDLVDWCVSHNLAGLENLAGIPGEVGASGSAECRSLRRRSRRLHTLSGMLRHRNPQDSDTQRGGM